MKIFALRFGHEHIVTTLHRLTCCTSLHRLTCCTSLHRQTCLHRTATCTATDMIAHHSQSSNAQMLYAQNSCSNLASSGAWLFLVWSAQGPDLLQVQEDDQSSLPMPLVASVDTVPVTCCVPLHVLHDMESLGNRVSQTHRHTCTYTYTCTCTYTYTCTCTYTYTYVRSLAPSLARLLALSVDLSLSLHIT